ncbi:27461_t:CDS:2, partial [Racocetra persica]
GEIVIAENSRLTIKVYELEQRIHALNFDKNELIHRVEELVNEKDRLETDNNQIHAANKNLTQLNNMLKIVLRNAEDKRDHYHAANIKKFDGFCMLWTQLRLRNYKYDKKASTIKSIFQDEEMHVDYHNGTFDDAIRYCKKDRNRCSKHHPYCRCDFFDLTKICNKCNKSCLEFRTFARVDNNSGPFEFGKLPTSHNVEGFNQHLEEQKKIRIQTIEDIKEQIKPINEIKVKRNRSRGVLLLATSIFMSQNNGKWFEGYDENKVFVFDDFYNHNIEFSTLLTLINNKPHTVQKKDTLYFGNEIVKIENKRKYFSIYNRFDYIIKYKKFRNDDIHPCAFECLCCSVKRIFQKGSYEDFVNLRFDIEFNSDVTLEQIAYIIENHNSIEESNGIRYYNHNFNSQIAKFELIDHRIENDKHVDMIVYPEVRRKLENRLHRTKRKKIQFKGYIENKLDYVIENLDENYDSDISISSLSSNDSETTRRRKKGKTVL